MMIIILEQNRTMVREERERERDRDSEREMERERERTTSEVREASLKKRTCSLYSDGSQEGDPQAGCGSPTEEERGTVDPKHGHAACWVREVSEFI
jgi:hypothetical protein